MKFSSKTIFSRPAEPDTVPLHCAYSIAGASDPDLFLTLCSTWDTPDYTLSHPGGVEANNLLELSVITNPHTLSMQS